jgi:DNA-binding transcriptional MerR regulator
LLAKNGEDLPLDLRVRSKAYGRRVTSYRIAEAAEQTAIPATTLRFYDEIGLAPAPQRSPAGYRLYDAAALERLRFIAHAKDLGLSLDEIKTLTELRDGGECGPVQAEMGRLVGAKISEVVQRRSELADLADQLRGIAARLGTDPHPGACDDACACAAAAPEPDIVCTLASEDDVTQRVDDWQRLAASARGREAIEGGMRLRFDPGPSLAGELAALAAAEVGCCGWLDFTVGVSAAETILDVHAPDAGMEVVTSLFG